MTVSDSEVPFSLMCACCVCLCDTGMGIDSREEAEALGWTDIEYNDGISWNYLGTCPECQGCE